MELLNCVLPERNSKTIASILEANNLPFRVPEIGEDNALRDFHYNCWGYVAFNFGWIKFPKWLSGEVMDDYLAEKTTPITQAEATVGDIAVFRRSGNYLTHTALVTMDINIICHKPGQGDLCVDTMERARNMYHSDVSYVRPKKVETVVDIQQPLI